MRKFQWASLSVLLALVGLCTSFTIGQNLNGNDSVSDPGEISEDPWAGIIDLPSSLESGESEELIKAVELASYRDSADEEPLEEPEENIEYGADEQPSEVIEADPEPASALTGQNIICYYGSWATYRRGEGKFTAGQVDPNLCTHVIYSFVGLNAQNEIMSLDPWNDFAQPTGLGSLKKLVALKSRNPSFKVMVAIGGWNEGSAKYSNMAANPSSRARFVRSVVNFLDKHRLDGLDVDWEYPGSRGGKRGDKKNFVLLLRDLKKAFAQRRYLLSAAVGVGQSIMDHAYDIKEVSRSLDFINLMTYDYHGQWESRTGLNAPLFGDSLSVDYSVNYWIKKGADPRKLMLGIGLYGRSFSLSNPRNNRLGAPANGPGKAGPLTLVAGILSYQEICQAVKHSWRVARAGKDRTPWAFKGNQWVGYDDPESIDQKVKYAKSKRLGGIMVWSIEQDDHSGKCGSQRYPLMHAIKRAMRSNTWHRGDSDRPGAGYWDDDYDYTSRRPRPTIRPGGGYWEDDDDYTSRRPRTRRPGSGNWDEDYDYTSRRPRTRRPGGGNWDDDDDDFTSRRPRTRRPNWDDTDGDYVGPKDAARVVQPTASDLKDTGKPECTGRENSKFLVGPTCKQYYECVAGSAILKDCQDGKVWRQEKSTCDEKNSEPKIQC